MTDFVADREGCRGITTFFSITVALSQKGAHGIIGAQDEEAAVAVVVGPLEETE